MSGAERPVDEPELQAWVDGRLPEHRHAAVQRHLAAHPQDAIRVQAYAEQRAMLGAALRFKADEPVPARLRRTAATPPRVAPRARHLALAASFLLVALLGGAAGWTGRGAVEETAAAAWRERAAIAVGAHRVFVADVRRPVEIRADAQDQLVGWLSNRLGTSIVVPDLTALGLRFMGGRLLPTPADGPAAQLMYDDGAAGQGLRFTLFILPGGAAAAGTRVATVAGVAAVGWSDGRLSYTLAAAMDAERLQAVARALGAERNPQDGTRA